MTESVLPTDAVEAAAESLLAAGVRPPTVWDWPHERYAETLARVALDAAVPFLREQWTAELEQVGWLADNGALLEYDERYNYINPPTDRPVFVHRQDTETTGGK